MSTTKNPDRLSNVLILLSFLDYLAVSLVYPQMGIRMRELGASQFMSGLISSSYGAIQLFSATAHGVVCDQYGRRIPLLLCLVSITCSYLALSGSMSFVSILVIRSVLGLVKHTQSTLKVIGGDIHTGTSRSTFISKSNSFSGLAFMIGPFLAAYFLEPDTSFQYGCWICSAIFMVTLVITYFFVEETLPVVRVKPDKPLESKPQSSILQRFKKYSSLQDIFIYRFCAAASVIILRYFTPLYTQHYFGFNAKHASYMTSFFGFSGIVCSSLAGYVAWLVKFLTNLSSPDTSLCSSFSVSPPRYCPAQ
ncbi:major facilitator superfamily domain-containing protein 9-like [Bolinopsis microptera]|uniref:major facilitator superfamily domain-containing protein 9-like n=1 Tax=Bolinopsis microptera TaxID=2820187 RepID=UPI003079863B